MNVLIVGSSSGLGRSLLEYYAALNHCVIGISRYNDINILNKHQKIASIVAKDLLECKSQDSFLEVVRELPSLDLCIYCIGGGYGKNSEMPSYEEMSLLVSLNLLVPSSILKSLHLNCCASSSTKHCFISSVASEEVVASVAYSSAKAALNAYGKTVSKKDNSCGPVVVIKLGAVEGSGSAFDRLHQRNIKAYDDFCKKRLKGQPPMHTSEITKFVANLMDQPTKLLDGLTIKLDSSESLSI